VFRRQVIITAAALLATCVIGSTLTANSHGLENVLSNICFFGESLLALFLIVASATALIRNRTSRGASTTATRP
jgi:predicted transporter